MALAAGCGGKNVVVTGAYPNRLYRVFAWAMDLTGKVTLDNKTTFVLGILEHACRAALCLEALHSKSSAALIGKLIENIPHYGKPRNIRTDNESVFTSTSFRLALVLLGIGHRRSDPGCPWQNGRVERFFGTLKQALDQLAVDSFDALCEALRELRAYYTRVRPHQNLSGATPAEAWAGVDPYAATIQDACWFEAWDGLLCGYYLRRWTVHIGNGGVQAVNATVRMRSLCLHQVGIFVRTIVGNEKSEGIAEPKRSDFGGEFVMRE